ncbi:hypothetical protein [Rhizobium rhizogenes]|uniref:hypothetical protein n=1 Tax=Rhizobium rhizogenes TaxID=359 RepID=UPI0024BE44DD|nr:hypothetical protein [Rhizobium rhizogenes]MDJ1637441.1 hypothetical protein [Rhizobium rhizogenes]
MKPISAATEQALREAMERLLNSRPGVSDARLTVINLAREAGVSRATANRATGVLGAFRRAIAESKARRNPIDQGSGTTRAEREQRAVENLLAQHRQVRALYQLQERRHESRGAIIIPITGGKQP